MSLIMNASELPRMPQFHIIDAAAPQGVQSPRSYQGNHHKHVSVFQWVLYLLPGWQAGWLVGWRAGGLVSWLAGWLVG